MMTCLNLSWAMNQIRQDPTQDQVQASYELFDEASNAIYEMDSNRLDITLSNAVAILSTSDFLLEFLNHFTLILTMSAAEGR